MLRLVLFLLLLFLSSCSSPKVEEPPKPVLPSHPSKKNPPYIISDKEFTFTNFTRSQVKSFFKSFSNNRFTDSDITLIYDHCKRNRISFLVIATKLEQENCLTRNNVTNDYEKRYQRGMAVGLFVKRKDPVTGRRYCPNIGFPHQIERGTYLLRDFFDSWKPGMKITMLQSTAVVTPSNASTWALYKFCPVYHEYTNYNVICVGNRLFSVIYPLMSKRWKQITFNATK